MLKSKSVQESIKLTDEQSLVIDELLKFNKKITCVGGLAGTGKTTLVSYLLKTLKGFACCAFTGKAAEVLRSKGVEASTIHSLIYNVGADDDDEEEPEVGTLVFSKKPSIPFKGIIVDEASMVGRSIYQDLISYDLPIIFIGDHGQLEPVNEDMYLMANPDHRLETVHRNAGDIARFAHHLRSGGEASDFELSKNSPVQVLQKKDCQPHLLNSDQIICALNSTRVQVNKYIRQLKGYNPIKPVSGDRVISLRNSRKYKIVNGSQGIVRGVRARKLTVEFYNKTLSIEYSPTTFNQEKQSGDNMYVHPFDYAYAVTCHKAQGSEWKKTFVLEQKISAWDHKRWAYTAASRAKETMIWALPD